ncbi:MAG: glycosyltransferase family 39 protein [Chloroflexi bacterium]|nr:glycosyltransferase family 39 protein [Chloroflexota bacterium]
MAVSESSIPASLATWNIRALHGRWLLVAVWVGLFLLRALIYLALTPPWQAPDEPTSMELLLTMEARGRLVSPADADLDIQREIVASMQRAHYWELGGYGYAPKVPNAVFDDVYACCGTQLHRPPLYHFLLLPAARLTSGWPLEQRLIVLRAASILLGMITVGLVTIISYELAVVHRALPLVMPALVAFHPQFTYISTIFNSDNLITLIGALFFLVLLRAMQRGLTLWRFLLLAGLIGVGFFTKRTIVFLAPALGLAVLGRLIELWRAYGRSARRWLLALGSGAILTVFAVAAVPALRAVVYNFTGRYLFFNDPLGYLGFISRGIFAPSVPMWSWFGTSLLFLNRSFWGSYGWHQVFIPSTLQRILLLCVVGTWLLALIWTTLRRRQFPRWTQRYIWLCVLSIGVALTITLLNAPAPVLPQGRYLFLVLIPIVLLMAIGLVSWWPRRWTLYGVGLVWSALILLDMYTLGAVFIPGFYP